MAGMEELRIPMSGLHVGVRTPGPVVDNCHTPMTDLMRPSSRMTVESQRSSNHNRATPVKGITTTSCSRNTSTPTPGMSRVHGGTAEMLSSSSPRSSNVDSTGSSSSATTVSTGRSYTSLSQSSSRSRHDCGYINDYSEVDYNTSVRQKRRNSIETMDTSMSVSEDLYTVNECHNKLVELELVPWNERDVLNVLREGRTKDLSGHISVEMMQRLSYLLQRPLLRIAREAQRLSLTFRKCTRHELHTSMKLILSRSLAESCSQACLKAVALYAMSGDNFRQSKSSRCGLHFSVGKFHRWMIDAQVSLFVHEYAAIYMAACMENLLEEIVLLSINSEHLGESVLGVDVLEMGIANNAELWGLLQPYEHLICGRNSSGVLSLPDSLVLCGNDYYRVKGRKYERAQDPMMKNVEQCLVATCVGSLAELVDLVSRAMHYWYNKPTSQGSTPTKQHPVTWGASALHALYYYMKCSQLEHADNPNIMPPSIHINYERSYSVLPPLIEWIRVGIAHTEHRRSWVVDDDDVRQAARLLLPGADCPPRLFSTDESLCTSRHLDAQKCAVKFQQDVAFRMLACGRSDLLPHAIALLGANQINTFNDQGMTPLMYACMKGDEAMVQMLLDAGAQLDVSVPGDLQNHPCVHPETKHWTALTFATVHCHMAIVQLLLERGARVEGSMQAGEDNYSESPLQLAAAAGHYELVAMLMSKGADPYLSTVHKKGITYNTSTRGSYNSFALAAAHGHRNILRKLLSQPIKSKVADILSLEEILAEGNSNTMEKNSSHTRQEKLKCNAEQNEADAYPDNVYVTIEEVAMEDSQFLEQTKFSKDKPKFTKSQLHSLQEALYHAAENGFLDITLELRNLGVPWSMHSWAQSLATAQRLGRRSLINCLLKDFVTIRQEEYNADFIFDTLPLMFDIFKQNKNEQLTQQLATVFSALFGPAPMPPIQELKTSAIPRIDSRYVNCAEMSDVQFLIEGKTFYGHKILLVNASHRFKAMLSDQMCENAGSSTPCIEINNIKYHIFEKMMQFLYNGTAESKAIDPNDILEVMAAANYFLLEGLQRHCEIILSKKLNRDNCILIYKHARLYNALELMAYCEGFFIQHLSSLLKSNEPYKKLVFGTKLQNYDVVNGLLATLTQRLEEKLRARTKKTFR